MEVKHHSSDRNDSMWSVSGLSKHGDGGVEILDFISRLPDSLLLDILSRLPARNAVSTTILSKRWQGLWTFTPALDICYSDVEADESYMGYKGMRRFMSFVNYTLRLHQSPNIRNFNVSLTYMNSFSYDINDWLLFALRKNVQKLKLYLKGMPCLLHESDEEDDDDDDWKNVQMLNLYVLPAFLFNSSSLVKLKISNCQFERQELIKWKSLKVLLLRIMSLNNDVIRDIISGCPSLESLKLYSCDNFDYIESKTLQNLVISYYNGTSEGTDDPLRISAPNLRSLQISESLRASRLSLINSSVSLVNANINFSLLNKEPDSERSCEMLTKSLRELLDKLCHVKYLIVGSWCLQVLSAAEENALLSLFSNLVSLTLHTRLKQCDRPGITRLLAMTPLLDTLVIHVANSLFGYVFKEEFLKSKDVNGENYWASHKSLLGATLQNLKTVQIVDFQGSANETEFIAFMLGNAKQLKKMIIQRIKLPGGTRRPSADTFISLELFSFPRFSSDVVILFY